MSIKNSILSIFIICNFLLVQNLYGDDSYNLINNDVLLMNCEAIDNEEECIRIPGCDWSTVATPNGVFEICIESDSGSDGDWNDDGGWDECGQLSQDECATVEFCEWDEELNVCVRFEGEDSGGDFKCSDLGYEECNYYDFCEWIEDSDNATGFGICIDAGSENPCSDFSQEDCEWYDECVWTDEGCQDYNWNDCDPNAICGQAVTCVDGLLYPTTCGPENCDDPIGECEDSGDGGGDCDPDLFCGEAITCVDGLLYPTTCGPENCDDPIGECDDNGDGPPECLLDCEGIEDINSDENPDEACDWIVSNFGPNNFFNECAEDCDEETLREISEYASLCYECLQSTNIDCSSVFDDNDEDCSDIDNAEECYENGCEWTTIVNPNGVFEICVEPDFSDDGGWDECSQLSEDECFDAEFCEPNFNAAGEFEGCVESSNIEGCYENGEFYCLGCELFVSDCDYYICTDSGFDGPFTQDECGEGDGGGCVDGGGLLAYLELEDVVGYLNQEVLVPMYLKSPESVGGVQFKLFNSPGAVPSGINSLDDCFTAEYNSLEEAYIGIIFSLEGCSYPANEQVHIADLAFEISPFVPIGVDLDLDFDYTIVSDSEGNEIESCGIGSSIQTGMLGDVNSDGEINILDIVSMVNFALGSDYPNDIEFWASDINGDGYINVLDIVSIVNLILQN